MKKIIFAFFGTSNFSVIVLNELKKVGFMPSLIITTEDKPKGRKLILSPSEVKIWAEKEKIAYIQPKTFKNPEVIEDIKKQIIDRFDVFVVASYGKIIPQNILDVPKHKTLNVHPSLLPKLRGPSPIQSTIISEDEAGVSIIKLDSEMDHGPILRQKKIKTSIWPVYYEELEKISGEIGGQLLAKILPDWIDGKIKEKQQNHNLATYCKKVEKTDAELDLNNKPEISFRKICAYHIWPGAFFFDNNKRIVVKKAHIEGGELILDRVVPEGKREMNYKDYLRGRK